MSNNSRIDEKERVGSYRVVTREWLDANGFSPLEDVIKRIESHKKWKQMLKKEFENVLGRIYLDSIGHKGQPPTIYSR